MCTSIAMKTDDFYFGRNMDLDCAFGERVVITPRGYPFSFRRAGRIELHHAIIGMATVRDGYPLYAEASNERGLCIAGLNFPENAYYPAQGDAGKACISPFELIPWVLGKCSCVEEACALLGKTCLVNIPFSDDLPVSPLHWHIADRNSSVVLESTHSGMQVYENPVGIMTNNPPFDFHLQNLCQYMNLTPGPPDNCFNAKANLKPFGFGLGSVGLPGDFSPASRFVKASYLLLNSISEADEHNSLSQFFHLLESVSMVRGGVLIPDGGKEKYEITTYSCCINADKGIYYYKTYTNHQITAVSLHHEDLDGSELIIYPIRSVQQIFHEN